MKYLAIGGCHLSGHIVGYENSFLNIALQDYAPGSTIDIKAPVKVSRVLEKLYDLDCCDVTLILQLGNYETGASLWVRNGGNPSSSGFHGVRLPSATNRASAAKSLLLSILKLPLLFIYDLIGKPPFDHLDFSESINSLFLKVSQLKFKRVLVVSSFYSLQPHLNIYRRRANFVMSTAAENYGFEWVDLFGVVGAHSSVGQFIHGHPLFADPEHLNMHGHKLIAKILGESIEKGGV